MDRSYELRTYVPTPEGVYDATDWHDIVAAGVDQAIAEGQAVSVLFCDLDFFKLVNDRLGHEAGDVFMAEILSFVKDLGSVGVQRQVEEAIEPEAPEVYVGRMGGDEIALFITAGEDHAEELKTVVRHGFGQILNRPENANIKNIMPGMEVMKIAIGCVTLQAGMNKSDLLYAADQAMRDDKLAQAPRDFTEEQKDGIARIKATIEEIGIPIEVVARALAAERQSLDKSQS